AGRAVTEGARGVVARPPVPQANRGRRAASTSLRDPPMNVLVLNAGSSTIKFELVRTDAALMRADEDRKLGAGVIERIGGEAVVTLRPAEGPARVEAVRMRDVREAVEWLLRWIAAPDSGMDVDSVSAIDAVGHRVVHGGEAFRASALVDDEVLRALDRPVELAPLHNPFNLRALRAAQEALGPGVPQVAVFDTAFHATLPEHAYLYAIPYSFYRRYRLRRYGFHGTSHRYVAWRHRKLRGIEKEEQRIVTLHLGNG